MTGSGTQADPYIVTTWQELVNAAAINGTKYINFPEEPGTINIEDEFGNEEPPCLTLQDDTYIDGSGWTIQGLWAETHSCMTCAGNSLNSTIKKLNFNSFHCKADYFRSAGVDSESTTINLENCAFSGICEKIFMHGIKGFYRTNAHYYEHFSDCSMNIQFVSLNDSVFLKTIGNYNYSNAYTHFEMSNCNIKIRSVNGIDLCNCQENYLKFHDCLFDIEAGVLNVLSGNINNKNISSCIFTGNSQSAITLDGISSEVVNIFNKDGFPNAVESDNFKGVTKEQLSNAQYLYDLGFPIGV